MQIIFYDLNPLRLFIYADMDSKMIRCQEKGDDVTALTAKKLQQKITSIDKQRARYYQFYTDQIWGDKINYDLCINTTKRKFEDMIPAIEQFII